MLVHVAYAATLTRITDRTRWKARIRETIHTSPGTRRAAAPHALLG